MFSLFFFFFLSSCYRRSTSQMNMEVYILLTCWNSSSILAFKSGAFHIKRKWKVHFTVQLKRHFEGSGWKKKKSKKDNKKPIGSVHCPIKQHKTAIKSMQTGSLFSNSSSEISPVSKKYKLNKTIVHSSFIQPRISRQQQVNNCRFLYFGLKSPP